MKTIEIYKEFIKYHEPSWDFRRFTRGDGDSEMDVYFCEIQCTTCKIMKFCHENYENMYFTPQELREAKEEFPELFI